MCPEHFSSTLQDIAEEVSKGIKEMFMFFYENYNSMHRQILEYMKYINVRKKMCYVYKEKQAESQNREHHQEISEVFTFFLYTFHYSYSSYILKYIL